jgi:hypothetical protein
MQDFISYVEAHATFFGALGGLATVFGVVTTFVFNYLGMKKRRKEEEASRLDASQAVQATLPQPSAAAQSPSGGTRQASAQPAEAKRNAFPAAVSNVEEIQLTEPTVTSATPPKMPPKLRALMALIEKKDQAVAFQSAESYHLVLGDRGIKDEWIPHILSSRHLANVTELSFQANGIGDAGATALANCPQLSKVIKLYLGNNEIGNAGVMALARIIHQCN